MHQPRHQERTAQGRAEDVLCSVDRRSLERMAFLGCLELDSRHWRRTWRASMQSLASKESMIGNAFHICLVSRTLREPFSRRLPTRQVIVNPHRSAHYSPTIHGLAPPNSSVVIRSEAAQQARLSIGSQMRSPKSGRWNWAVAGTPADKKRFQTCRVSFPESGSLAANFSACS